MFVDYTANIRQKEYRNRLLLQMVTKMRNLQVIPIKRGHEFVSPLLRSFRDENPYTRWKLNHCLFHSRTWYLNHIYRLVDIIKWFYWIILTFWSPNHPYWTPPGDNIMMYSPILFFKNKLFQDRSKTVLIIFVNEWLQVFVQRYNKLGRGVCRVNTHTHVKWTFLW